MQATDSRSYKGRKLVFSSFNCSFLLMGKVDKDITGRGSIKPQMKLHCFSTATLDRHSLRRAGWNWARVRVAFVNQLCDVLICDLLSTKQFISENCSSQVFCRRCGSCDQHSLFVSTAHGGLGKNLLPQVLFSCLLLVITAPTHKDNEESGTVARVGVRVGEVSSSSSSAI